MPTISDLKQSRFITKDDVIRPLLVTIKGYHQDNVAPSNEPEETKYLLDFVELPKPLVMNYTKGVIIGEICGSNDLADWKGHKIVLFHDPNVMMGAKRVGGIGVRAPKNIAPVPKPAPPKPSPAPIPSESEGETVEAGGAGDDDVPF